MLAPARRNGIPNTVDVGCAPGPRCSGHGAIWEHRGSPGANAASAPLLALSFGAWHVGVRHDKCPEG
jgi:hypothetical protein